MDQAFLEYVDGLVARGKRDELKFGDIATRVLTDAFLATRGPAPLPQAFMPTVIRALAAASDEGAANMARVLAPLERTPPELIDIFLTRGGACAAAVLAQKSGITPSFLLARAESGSAAEAVAIAGRSDLNAKIIAALARRPEGPTLRALAENRAIAIDPGVLPYLAQRSRTDRALAAALLERWPDDLDASALFLAANAERRAAIIAAVRRETLGAAFSASPLAGAADLALPAAAEGDADNFCATLARMLGCSRGEVEALVFDGGGEPLALIFAAMATPFELAQQAMCALAPHLAPGGVLPARLKRTLDAGGETANRLIETMLGGRAMRWRSRGEFAPRTLTHARMENEAAVLRADRRDRVQRLESALAPFTRRA
ncbi:MAG: DUF2336 domain-containing protein [Hyphomicrobiales bacterium]|nr:DUF2336 domain-containing protein [Hyphomicrobiales bacterium]